MIFIGSGSLLFEAAAFSKQKGFCIDQIYCPIGDSALPKLQKINVNITEIEDPNKIRSSDLKSCIDGKVLSINNGFIIKDNLLQSGLDFFNIHNGIVEKYRGISEVCVLAAICNEEKEYGVTLHKIQPLQKVDSGPVIKQLRFTLNRDDTFYDVMFKSLFSCKTLFENCIEEIVNDRLDSYQVSLIGQAYRYSDIPNILRSAPSECIKKASELGPYASFFPRLSNAIKNHQYSINS